ncbi:uncharacterized protein LOC142793660 [Rhipicephalus microplus]|uniref:uncharacterized protein LOC142793660 n=1 Tax=Rhipicephalus microplus TaxID=6941 RepID=UPI003F6D05EF
MRWSQNPFVFLLQFLGLLGPLFPEPFDLRVRDAHAPHPATCLIFPCRSSTAHPDHLPLQISATWASLIPEAVQVAPLHIPAMYERPVHSSATGHGSMAGMRWSQNPFVFLLQFCRTCLARARRLPRRDRQGVPGGRFVGLLDGPLLLGEK